MVGTEYRTAQPHYHLKEQTARSFYPVGGIPHTSNSPDRAVHLMLRKHYPCQMGADLFVS